MRCSNAMMPTWFGATENENVNCCVCGIGAEPIIIIIVVAMAAKIRGQKCEKRAKNSIKVGTTPPLPYLRKWAFGAPGCEVIVIMI